MDGLREAMEENRLATKGQREHHKQQLERAERGKAQLEGKVGACNVDLSATN
jgi:hypothetical protein